MEKFNNNYTVEDLVANVSFQQYCTGRNVDAVRDWELYFKKHPEQQAVAKEATKLYLLLSGNHPAKQYSAHLELFKSKIEGHTQLKIPLLKSRRSYRLMWLAAACVLIVSAILILFSQNYFSTSTGKQRTFISGAGEKKTIKLDDGTTVVLNGASTLVLSDGFNLENRRLRLEGEGYFEVTHNDRVPFVVETKSLLITDLGTKFNVKAFAKDGVTEASLIEGLIEIVTLDQPDKKILLKPNQKITFRNAERVSAVDTVAGKTDSRFTVGSISKNTAVNTIVETDWVRNRLTFNDEDFIEIASKLERWYGLEIQFEKESIKRYKYVGTFENQSITEVLDILKLSRDFKYRKEGSLIIIY